MAGAILCGLPFVPCTHNSPSLPAVGRGSARGFLALQFFGGEFTAQAHIVIDAQRLLDALAQCGITRSTRAQVPTGLTYTRWFLWNCALAIFSGSRGPAKKNL